MKGFRSRRGVRGGRGRRERGRSSLPPGGRGAVRGFSSPVSARAPLFSDRSFLYPSRNVSQLRSGGPAPRGGRTKLRALRGAERGGKERAPAPYRPHIGPIPRRGFKKKKKKKKKAPGKSGGEESRAVTEHCAAPGRARRRGREEPPGDKGGGAGRRCGAARPTPNLTVTRTPRAAFRRCLKRVESAVRRSLSQSCAVRSAVCLLNALRSVTHCDACTRFCLQ